MCIRDRTLCGEMMERRVPQNREPQKTAWSYGPQTKQSENNTLQVTEKETVMRSRSVEWEAEATADWCAPNNGTPGCGSHTATGLKEETHNSSSKKVQYSTFSQRTTLYKNL